MIRKIVHIDEERCNGCGLCAEACHEGAIEMVNGKAKLTRDDYCDGFGDCLPGCPTGAIRIEEREAAAYDENAVQAHKREKSAPFPACPGVQARQFEREHAALREENTPRLSELKQWPTQIKLMPIRAPYYDGAKLLVAADCTAFAYASLHEEFIREHVTINGCPKLDAVDYSTKLTQILSENDIQEVIVVRMEVPCCGGLVNAVKRAVQQSGKNIPLRTSVISIDGRRLS